MKNSICSMIILLAIFSTVTATAQLANLNSIIIGDRAFGLGGAFTALASDATAGWYNPAGLGFIDRTYINATGNVYGYDHATSKNYYSIESNTGSDGSADLDEKQTLATPATFSLAKKITDFGTLGFGVYVPRDFGLDDYLSAGVDYDGLFGPTRHEYYEKNKYTARDIYFGPSYGSLLNDHFAFGGTAFILSSSSDLVSTSNIVNTSDQMLGQFFSTTQTYMEKVTYLGARFSLGAMAEFNELRFGVNIFSPTVRLSEHTDRTITFTNFVGTVTNENFSGSTTEKGRGWEIMSGLSWEKKELWAVALDVTYYHPEFENDIASHNVTNFKVGGEYYLTSKYIIRAGFFTDYSAWDLDGQNMPLDIDIYGCTLQFVYQDHIPNTDVKRSFSIGFRYAFGNGQTKGTLVTNPDIYEFEMPDRDIDYENIGIMLGGTFSY